MPPRCPAVHSAAASRAHLARVPHDGRLVGGRSDDVIGWSTIQICGKGEMEKGTVNIRLREATHQDSDGKMTDQLGEMSLDAAIELFNSDVAAFK